MRRVDRLGRIVIPLELRKKYGLSEGVEVEFVDVGDGVTVRSSDSFCRVCHAKISDDVQIPLCERCTLQVLSKYK